MIRKAFLTTFLLILFTLCFFYSAWNLFDLSESAKKIVLSKIKTTFGERCIIEEINFGFGTINLEGVQLFFAEAPYEIWIGELRLGYSIGSLLKNSTSPHKTANEITIYRPRLTLLYRPQKNQKTDVDLTLQLSIEAEEIYRSIIKEYDFIKRITISDGEIVILDTEKERSVHIARQINGWAYTNDKDQAWIRVAGHLFDTNEYNMVMYGRIDFNRSGLDYLNIDLHNYKLGNALPFILPDYINILSGRVDGHLTVTERLKPTRGFNIEGNVTLNEGKFKIASEQLFIENMNFEAEIKDWNINIKKSIQTINGSPVFLNGSINNFLHPLLDLRLTSTAFDIEKFLKQFLPQKELPFHGKTAFDIKITDPIAKPLIEGSLVSKNLTFVKKDFKNLRVKLNLYDSFLRLDSISCSLDRARLNGFGDISFKSEDKPLNFELDLSGNFTDNLKDIGINTVDSCLGVAKIKIFGSTFKPVSIGEFDLTFVNQKTMETDIWDGSFRYNPGGFTLNIFSSKNDFRLNASIDSIFTQPFFNVEATGIEEVIKLLKNGNLSFLQKRFNINLLADGPLDKLNLTVDGYKKSNYEKVLEIKATSINEHKKNNIAGDIVLLPNSEQSVSGNFSLVRAESILQLKNFEIGNWIIGSFEIPENNNKNIDGKFTISGLSLPLLLSVFGERNPENYGGELFGQISMEGPPDSTTYNGNIWLLDGFIAGLGPMKGQLTFIANSDSLKINKLSFEDSEEFSLLAEANYNYKSKELNANIAGTHVQVEDILALLAEKNDVVSGDANIQISLKGQFPEIPLYGNIDVHNARILMLNFDEVIFNFGSEETPNGSYFSTDKFFTGDVSVSKSNEFSLDGSVILPLKGGNEVDLKVSGDGNFLAILSDLAGLFEDSKSNGHMDLSMTGHYTKPVFSGSKLTFDNGELQLSSVVKKITNLTGNLEVIPQDYFLNINKFAGTIEDRSIAISNTNNVGGLDHGAYEPLRLGGDDLNLGALILSTDYRGIPIHIPGLMEHGEIGNYIFAGRTDNEPFFITGPWRRPNVRGKIILSNSNLMFPFDENLGEGNPIIQNIIDNINWDVYAVSAKDTRYVRQFTTGVYVNMEVDNKNSGLQFSGILKDSTFAIGGKVESTRGEIEYFDLNFRVEKMGAEFNQSSLYPIVYGKAWTVIRDSSNVPNDVYLTLFTVDDITNSEVKKGRWDRINVKLSSEYPVFEETQTDLMAQLGYSSDTIDEQAKKAVGSSTDNFLFKPILRPIERELERKLQLDVVRFSYAIARNFLDTSFNNEQLNSSLALLRSSRLILGKYLTNDVYVLYTGELKAGLDYQFTDKGIGLQHIFGLEYRLSPKWLLQMEYDYNTLFETHKDDKKIWLRHSFPF